MANQLATPFAARSSIESQVETSAWNSLRSFPARLLPELPAAFVLHLEVAGAPVPVRIHTGTASLREVPSVLAACVEFDGEELRALARGVEADRLWHREFLGFCFEKWRNPSFRVSTAQALAGVNPDEQAEWSVERVLLRLQASVTEVVFLADAADATPALRSAA